MKSAYANPCIISFVATMLTTAIMLFAQQSSAQKNNAVHAELGGSGIYYSLNYERSFKKQFIARAGVGAAVGNVVLPVHFGKYWFGGNHHLEVDLGLSYLRGKIDNTGPGDWVMRNQFYASAFVGYRYQNPAKRSLFRIGYIPLYSLHASVDEFDYYYLHHWAGVSYGFRF